jgi:hypothetical protein
MKKATLLISVVVACLTQACSNDDIVSSSQSKAITFGSVFVNKPTRATEETTDKYDIDYKNLDGFRVYIYKSEDNRVTYSVENVDVTRSTDTYLCSYSDTKYWDENCDYTFVALAPYSDSYISNITSTGFTFNNSAEMANGEKDLVQSVEVVDKGKTEGDVAFSFNHLLSKIKVKIVNDYENALYTITLSSVKLTCDKAVGNYVYSTNDSGNWSFDSESSEKFEYTFLDADRVITAPTYSEENGWTKLEGEILDEYCYVIPTNDESNVYKLNITGTMTTATKESYNATICEIDENIELTSDNFNVLKDGFKQNKGYILSVIFGTDNVIKFELNSDSDNVEGWDEYNGIERSGTVPTVTQTEATDEAGNE